MISKQKIVLIGLVCAIATHEIALAAPPADAEPPEWLEDAKIIANQEGISVGEAVRRIKMEAHIAALEERLERENPNTFAGMRIDRDAKNSGYVSSTKARPLPMPVRRPTQKLLALSTKQLPFVR